MHVERFAPSPTGPLHLGHAFSALTAWDLAQAARGVFLLRIEDIDRARARTEWEKQIFHDLRWLGLRWPEPVLRQSARAPAYHAALQTLWARGLLYTCTCTRRDIETAASAPQEGAPMHGPDGLVYPGTCRDHAPRKDGTIKQGAAIRLDMARALHSLGDGAAPPAFDDTGPCHPGRTVLTTEHLVGGIGDIVIARKGMGTSYHLSVVVDDAHQGVSHVTRGADLFGATAIHVVLQRLLGLPTPVYHHHRLIRDAAGKRLAKRDDARALARYRAEGATPADIRAMVGL